MGCCTSNPTPIQQIEDPNRTIKKETQPTEVSGISSKIQPIEGERYIASFIEDNPHSLLILKNSRHFMKSIFHNHLFIWIYQNKEEIAALTKGYDDEAQFHIFVCVEQAERQIKNRFNERNLTVITSQDLSKQVQNKISCLVNVQRIWCYCRKIQIYQQLKQKKQLGQKFEFASNSSQKLLQKFTQIIQNPLQQKTLPNFISLKDDGQISNIQRKCLSLMVKQTCSRKKIIAQFCSLAQLLYPQSASFASIFKVEAEKKELNIERAIYWYTAETPIYQTLNKLLRSSKNPSQLFYAQPFVKDLFNSIKQLYMRQKNNYKGGNFKCFRGGRLNLYELQKFQCNVGQIFQNLGFLSTSKSLQIAENFVKNVLFQIDVEVKSDYNKQNGFADISKLQFNLFGSSEKQILFNCLNSFRLCAVTEETWKNKKIFKINLQYGYISKISSIQNELLTERQKCYIAQNNFKNNQGKKIKCQGDIFVKGISYSLEGGIYYWKKFNEIAKNQEEKALGFLNSGIIKKQNGKYSQSLQFFKKAKIIWQEIDAKSYHYQNIVNTIGLLHYKLGNYQHALESLKQCQTINLFLSKKDTATIVLNIAYVFQQLNRRDEAINKFKQALIIFEQQRKSIKQKSGTMNNSYASMLGKIGLIQQKIGKFKDAMQTYMQMKNIKSVIFGVNSLQNADVLQNIGVLYGHIGKYSSSVSYLLDCLKIRQSLLNKDHPKYITGMKQLAQVYKLQGLFIEAQQLSIKVKQIYQNIHQKGEQYNEICRQIKYLNEKIKESDGNSKAFQSLLQDQISKQFNISILQSDIKINMEQMEQ